MLTAFFDRVKPDSTSVNPACMKNTSIPESKIQRIVKSSFTSTKLNKFDIKLRTDQTLVYNFSKINDKQRIYKAFSFAKELASL